MFISRAALSRDISKLLSIGLLTSWMRCTCKFWGVSVLRTSEVTNDVVQKIGKKKLNNTHAATQKRARRFHVAVKTPFLPTCPNVDDTHRLISALQS